MSGAARDATLEVLIEAAAAFPQLRVGQLIENAVGHHDLFYVEDFMLRDLLAAYMVAHGREVSS